jgi:hypothetical protein
MPDPPTHRVSGRTDLEEARMWDRWADVLWATAGVGWVLVMVGLLLGWIPTGRWPF